VYGGGCYAGGTNDGYIYTAPVGSFSPSGDGPFGICDMAGNVGEWCEDFYDENYYDVCPRDDPSGPSSGIWHATRGGDWDFGVRRSADRWYQAPMWGDRSLGFRVVFVLRDE
jgi:formylglycine-generating enzyme required for sulfatase activity